MNLRPLLQAGPHRRRTLGAFTLVEVILAIGIAMAILVAALVFYQQAADFRNQLIGEAERLSTMRLVMDRLTTDLRCAFAQPQVGFTGHTDSMQFVRVVPPDVASSSMAGTPGIAVRLPSPASDLRQVNYLLTAAAEGTNFVVTGLDRTEEPLLHRPIAPVLSAGAVGGPLTISAAAPLVTGTNALPAAARVEPMAPSVRFARFRYWSGAEWVDDWDSSELPRGVEVSLGADPLPENELPEDYPYELFRRVILVPAAASAEDDWWSSL